MATCPNINDPSFKKLEAVYGRPQATLFYHMNGEHTPSIEEAKAMLFAKKTPSTLYQLPSIDGKIVAEQTIRDIAARMAERVGMDVRFESDRTKEYKGRIDGNTAVVNLAYATMDTPIHEILGHPIIRAIKGELKTPYFKGDVHDYTKDPNAPGKYAVSYTRDTESFDMEFFDTLQEAQEWEKEQSKPFNTREGKQLYQNLLKELEYGTGKEVLDRIKRDYVVKRLNSTPFEKWQKEKYKGQYRNPRKDYASDEQYTNVHAKDIEQYTKETGKGLYENYTLEEQQEEALVELLGLMTANKLDAVKDGKLISLLKRLLKEIASFVKNLINSKEIEVNKLPDNMTLNDIADILAYSNSKLILPGYEVLYTTPDNQQFKSYGEASKHISNLAKNNKEANITENSWEVSWRNWSYDSDGAINEDTHINFEYFPTKEAAENYAEGVGVRGKIAGGINIIKTNGLSQDFINKNKEYEQSEEIIEKWKTINDIKYNPEEIYSRGQGFYSVVGAYSDFDVNLMFQNILHHIEDNQKAGGEFVISAFTKPVDRKIGHLEGGGGKIKFVIYPQPDDIKWAANADVYSGSVWDAGVKVNKDKRSELLGVSYTKAPSLNSLHHVKPNLTEIIDDLDHHHNELGIALTGKNFRIEYDDNIPAVTKKILNSVNSILYQKYGKIDKPLIKKQYFGIEENAKEDSGAILGVQPTITSANVKESIDKVKNKIIKVEDNVKGFDKKNYPNNKIGDIVEYKGEKFTIVGESEADTFFPATWNVKPVKEYTSKALVNKKIAALKEVAKKYPRSLIRTEVKRKMNFEHGGYDQPTMFEDDLPFQKIPSKQELSPSIEEAKAMIQSPVVYAQMKVLKALGDPKAQQLYTKFFKNNPEKFYSELLQLGAPKNQVDILRDHNSQHAPESFQDMVTSLAAAMSYTVEINTATQIKRGSSESFGEPYQLKDSEYPTLWYVDTGTGDVDFPTKEDAIEYIKRNNKKENSSYYSNLTVPGGTNYTENEIATPGITPSIKGHAQFSTDNGIGWFRSDDKVKADTSGAITITPEGQYVSDQSRIQFDSKGNAFIKTNSEVTKTRRILEVQSDYGQKQRKSAEPDIHIKYDVDSIINDLKKSGKLRIIC